MASPLDLIPDKNIAQSRSHCPTRCGKILTKASSHRRRAPAHEFIMNEFPGV
jgi:hypothetical protein